jgi:hypothetical protein
MRKVISTGCALVLAASALSPLSARQIPRFTYPDLLKQSDLVVIATPTARTADTTECAFFPNIYTRDSLGRLAPLPAAGVETPFVVSIVLKGDESVVRFVLHHYREVSEISMDSPSVLHFDPSDIRTRGSYLMFLMKEADGRYAPTGGQTDPRDRSVFKVPGLEAIFSEQH